jgi:hypothetical protein
LHLKVRLRYEDQVRTHDRRARRDAVDQPVYPSLSRTITQLLHRHWRDLAKGSTETRSPFDL